jgi:hypothetical protein
MMEHKLLCVSTAMLGLAFSLIALIDCLAKR